MRVLRQRLFFASTVEELDDKVCKFLVERTICVGNYVDIKLFKLGSIYQYILIYAELVGDR